MKRLIDDSSIEIGKSMALPKARPFLSICIPAYNRSEVFAELLESILNQSFKDFEIVICEDQSKQRQLIAKIAQDYSALYPNKIFYFENPSNLGYDGNLRELIKKSRGEYCVFMGNDDLLAPDGLSIIASSLNKHPDAGVFLRTYAAFNVTPENIDQVFRYFPEELYMAPGIDTVSLFYRRSVVIPGMTLHRDSSLELETSEFDGSLLYQLYLVGNLLSKKAGVYSPEIVSLYRNDGIPDFGNAPSEKGRFVPNQRTPESSLHFMKSMLQIAAAVEKKSGLKVYKRIFQDMANYSYPFIAIQRDKGPVQFTNYAFGLAKLGFYKSPMFWAYFTALLVIGPKKCDALIRWIKRKIGRTPRIGYSLSSSKT